MFLDNLVKKFKKVIAQVLDANQETSSEPDDLGIPKKLRDQTDPGSEQESLLTPQREQEREQLEGSGTTSPKFELTDFKGDSTETPAKSTDSLPVREPQNAPYGGGLGFPDTKDFNQQKTENPDSLVREPFSPNHEYKFPGVSPSNAPVEMNENGEGDSTNPNEERNLMPRNDADEGKDISDGSPLAKPYRASSLNMTIDEVSKYSPILANKMIVKGIQSVNRSMFMERWNKLCVRAAINKTPVSKYLERK